MTFDELQTKGMVKEHIPNIDMRPYLDGLAMSSKRDSWDVLKVVDFPTKVLESVTAHLEKDPLLRKFIGDIKIQVDRCKVGHYQPPHNDSSSYSPFIAQLFISDGASTCLLAGRTDNINYRKHPIKDGDLLFFYTYPNDLVFSFTEVAGDDMYVVGFLPSAADDLDESWIYKDIDRPYWPRKSIWT